MSKKLTEEQKAANKAARAAKKETGKATENKAPAKAKGRPSAAEEKNGVKRPLKADSKCGQVWAICDKLTKKVKSEIVIPTVQAVLVETEKAGLNPNNAKVEYAAWRKFNGHAAIWNGNKKEEKKAA